MSINSTLAFVRGMVKAEAAKNLDSTSNAQDNEMNQIIYDVQEWLASDYPWPHLRRRWDVAVGAGARYVTFPTVDHLGETTSIDVGRLGDIKVFVKWNAVWIPVIYGIDEIEEFNYLDSDANAVLDPVQRWFLGGNGTTFEIWPKPASAQTLRFAGQRVMTALYSSLSPLTWNDAATLDLDGQMVAYFVIAEYLAREKKPNAQYFLGLATSRMNQIRRTYPRVEKPVVIGGADRFDRRALKAVPLVLVGGSVAPSGGSNATITGPGGGAVGVG